MDEMARFIDQQNQELQDQKINLSWYESGGVTPHQAAAKFPHEEKHEKPLSEVDNGSEHLSGNWQTQDKARKMDPSVRLKSPTTHANFPAIEVGAPPARAHSPLH